MAERSSLDPIEEARARIRLRYAKAKAVHPGPGTLGKAAMRIARKKVPSKGATLSKLKLEWDGIVGEQLARLCRPEKLGPARGGRLLTLRVIPAAAGLVQHQSEMIRQRVSVAAGGDITAVKIVQGQFGARVDAPVRKAAALTPEQREALLASARNIEDHKLRAAIVALGEAVLTASSDVTDETGPTETPLPF